MDTRDTASLQVAPHVPTPGATASRLIELGMADLRAQRYEAASTRLARGVELLPEQDAAREALYVAYRRQGRLAEAEGVLREGLALALEPARFAKLLARELVNRDAGSDALQVLALHVPPVTADPEYHALRAALLQREARYAEALPVYAGLVSHYPDNGTWLAGLAMAQDQAGDRAEAMRNYRRALQAGGLAESVRQYASERLAELEAAGAAGE